MEEVRCEKCGMLKSNHQFGSDECPTIGVDFDHPKGVMGDLGLREDITGARQEAFCN